MNRCLRFLLFVFVIWGCFQLAVIVLYFAGFDSVIPLFEYTLVDEDAFNLLRRPERRRQFPVEHSPPAAMYTGQSLHDIDEHNKVNAEFRSALLLRFDVAQAQSLVDSYRNIDVNFLHHGAQQKTGSVLYDLCSSPENSRIMNANTNAINKNDNDNTNANRKQALTNVLDFILAQPNVNPNENGDGFPSPLAGALSVRNQVCVVRMLRHPRTAPTVLARHLTCEIIPHILPEITVVISGEYPACFADNKHHGSLNVIGANTEAYDNYVNKLGIAKLEIKMWETVHRRGADALTHAILDKINQDFAKQFMNENNNNNDNIALPVDDENKGENSRSNNNRFVKQQDVSKQSRTRITPWKLVLDPTEFESAFEFVWFYFIGRDWVDSSWYVKALIFGVVAHSLLVVGACGFYLHTMEDNEKAGIMPDVITPPATPQFGAAAAPQQNQENNLALPAAAVERREEGEQEGAQVN